MHISGRYCLIFSDHKKGESYYLYLMFGALCFEGSRSDSVRFWALEFVDFPKWLAKHQMKFLSCNPSKEVSFSSMLDLISTWLGISRVSSSYSLFSHHVIAEWLPYALAFKELHISQKILKHSSQLYIHVRYIQLSEASDANILEYLLIWFFFPSINDHTLVKRSY